MDYIKIPKVNKKLKEAEEQFRPVAVFAPTGYGKTMAVTQYYKRKATLYLSGKTGQLDEMPTLEQVRASVVIVDDSSWITDDDSWEYISGLILDGRFQVILIGRGRFPEALRHTHLKVQYVYITEEDLKLDREQIRRLLEQREVTDETLVDTYAQTTRGYPIAVYYSAELCKLHKEPVGEAFLQEVWIEIFHYFDRELFSLWKRMYQEFALAMCECGQFSIEMAEYIAGEHRAAQIVDYYMRTGSFVLLVGKNEFAFREEMARFLQWKRNAVYTNEEQQENYKKTAYYYEKCGDIGKALTCYDKADAKANIKQLLIKNAQLHAGTGHYFEARQYYFALNEEEIVQSPVLMAGMSMLCSIIMRPEQSDYWYERLKAFEADRSNDRQMRQEARERLLYLEIGLPHRGIANLIPIFKKAVSQCMKHHEVVPEMSVTSNLPSLMNGGLDFCEWSKNDHMIAKFMQKPIEFVLRDYGKGIADVALAESGFTKGCMSSYEVVTRLNTAYQAIENGGKLEMLFVAEALLVKQHLLEGQTAAVVSRMDNFEKRLVAGQADKIFLNWQAFRAWVNLYLQKEGVIEEYLATAPNEQVEFCVLDRYRYMIKLRALIAAEKYTQALDLSSYLNGYFVQYHRIYHHMENELLKAVILYRMGEASWESVLKEVLQKLQEYHFVRLIALEGAAVFPLLKQLKDTGLDKEFEAQVLDETAKMALRYPRYLAYVPRRQVELTQREQQILTMLCMGMKTDDICRECGITYNGLKKHNKNIYRKLGVESRVEAERVASQLGLSRV